jgi:hypothetical protein
MLDLIERMNTIVPKGLDSYFFWNSGTEAIEGELNNGSTQSMTFAQRQSNLPDKQQKK